jgi:hypothetical protein
MCGSSFSCEHCSRCMFHMNIVYIHLCFMKMHSRFDHFFALVLNAFSIVFDPINKLMLRSVFTIVSGTCFKYSTFSRRGGYKSSWKHIEFCILKLNQVCLDKSLASGSYRTFYRLLICLGILPFTLHLYMICWCIALANSLFYCLPLKKV